jgi:hypothetical protein
MTAFTAMPGWRAKTSCKIFDLGSSNGTRLNGLQIDKAELKPGDVIGIGNSQLRYEISLPFDEATMTMKYEEEDLEQAYDQDVLPVAINETGVLFLEDLEVPLEDADGITIGTNPAR